jgi:hypothetical protein
MSSTSTNRTSISKLELIDMLTTLVRHTPVMDCPRWLKARLRRMGIDPEWAFFTATGDELEEALSRSLFNGWYWGDEPEPDDDDDDAVPEPPARRTRADLRDVDPDDMTDDELFDGYERPHGNLVTPDDDSGSVDDEMPG